MAAIDEVEAAVVLDKLHYDEAMDTFRKDMVTYVKKIEEAAATARTAAAEAAAAAAGSAVAGAADIR